MYKGKEVFLFVLHYPAVLIQTEMERPVMLSICLSLYCYAHLNMFKTTKRLKEPMIVNIYSKNSFELLTFPTNTPLGFHVETTWKRPFPRRFNMESMWCVCRV